MIVVQLAGGLGNQLFQYALGRRLASDRGTSLAFDLSFLEDRSPRPEFTVRDFALAPYGLGVRQATAAEVARLRTAAPPLADRLRRRLFRRTIPHHRQRIVREQGFRFDPSILKVPHDCLLVGYWQAPAYFDAVAGRLRRELALPPPVGRNAELLREVRGRASVGVHVRRGDYVSLARTNAIHGVCPPEYYVRALELVVARVTAPHFFAFSDDLAWVRENMRFPGPVAYVDHNQEAPHEDVRLLSACRHVVIANSSLSWWGAWLSPAERIVVAPARWFRDPAVDTSDLTPPSWIRL